MRWLHLSDIHVGKPGATAQAAAISNLVEAVHSAACGVPFDAVFITGDIAYAGTKAQYDNFSASVLGPLRALPEFSSAKIVVAPGNHDVDCDASLPLAWSTLGQQRQDVFFEETPDGVRLRAPRAVSFTAYSNFLRDNNLLGTDPLKEVTATFTLGSGNQQVHVVSTNTAFFCDKFVPDREQLPLPDPSLRTVLQRIPRTDRVLILGHHPIYWLLQSYRNPLLNLLSSHKAIYLHGHVHEIETSFGPEGLAVFGFGAGYQARQGALPTPYYRNSFAICQMADDTLHVAPFSWDSENGRWAPTTTLPPGFLHSSTTLPHGWRFKLATGAAPPVLGLPQAAATHARVIRISSLGNLSAKDWLSFILYASLAAPDLSEQQFVPKSAPPGEFFFEYRLPAGLHYIHCISAPGSHLHPTLIEAINTRLDTAGYQSYTLVTLGTLTDEAETTYQQLRTRKAITIFTAKDLATRLASLAHFSRALNESDAAIADSEFLIAPGGSPLLLVQDKSQARWFYLVSGSGELLSESHPTAVAVRRARPELERATYRAASQSDVPLVVPSFDRPAYLAACRAEFRAVKYAPLATVGLRFPGIPLEELYVETSAQPADEGSRHVVGRALADFLRSARVDGVLKEELSQLLSASSADDDAPINRQEETSARALYRHHGAVGVLGDPGSGKTCFVKREVLSYCAEVPESWYSKHTPIFMALSEVAAHYGGAVPDMLAMAALLAQKHGLPIELPKIRELFSRGELAIFLDGLDEVVSVEARSRILAGIRALMDEGAPLGNRLVLTSRPAAIHRSELPRHLELIRMRGLSDAEMRTLAERILAARVSEAQGTISFDVTQLGPTEQATLEQFLTHCRTTPGLDRLARNPLFLTLLVMIYSSSGSASARRHRVYSQAISTLVSVRARDAGPRGLSESDLRRRLGAVALEVFRDPLGVVPTYDRVVAQIRRIIEDERGTSVPRDEVEDYVRDVAEATGLLVLHRSDGASKPSAVTFMHHSFLEYYAAVGLSATDYATELPGLARVPRWRDVITLLCGIVSDTSDSSPIVASLLGMRDSYENLTLDCTLLAFDCSLETDVPPERVLFALTARVHESLVSGALAADVELRGQIGRRLGKLLAASNAAVLHRFVVEGLKSAEDALCAAYVDVCGHIATEVDLAPDALLAFDNAATRASTEVRIAVCRAAARASRLRSARAMACVAQCLDGSAEMRTVALGAILDAPSLGKELLEPLARTVDDSSPAIAEKSARALMRVGASLDKLDVDQATWFAKSLRRVAESASLESSTEFSLSYARADVEPLLSSADRNARLLGIQMLPWVVDSSQYVHDTLMQVILGSDRQERVAALASLRIARTALMLLRVTEAHELRRLLRDGDTRDVRIGAARVLGMIAMSDADIVRDLVVYAQSVAGSDQYEHAILILSWSARDSDVAEAFLLEEAERILLAKGSLSEQRKRDLRVVLQSLNGLDAEGSPRLVNKLKGVAVDYKFDIELRRQALYAFVAVAPVDVAVKWLRELLSAAPARLGYGVISAASKLVARCRRRLEYMSTVYPNLLALQEAVVDYHSKAMATAGNDAKELAGATRCSLVDIRHMYSSYREFSERERDIERELGDVAAGQVELF